MTTRPWRCVPRYVALLSFRPGLDAGAAEPSLRRCAERVRAHSGERARVRVGLRIPEDPLATMLASRGGAAPVDAALEITLPEDRTLDELPGAASGLAGELEGLVEPGASALLAGLAHLIVEGGGPIFLALAGRRDPNITVEGMRRWWIEQHSVLVRRIIKPFPDGYEQLHVDRALSRRAARAAGFGPEEFDAFDSINARSVDALLGPVMKPEVARQLHEDELGYADHSSFRGAMCRVL
ncbi:MAG: EthD domain-containing protein [Deltaproteobacteria bacterium]|nr:EthD domain-containing protein [Deltaproteobacteria bacterium]